MLNTVVAPISLPAPGDSLTGINEMSCVITGWGATIGKIKVVVNCYSVKFIGMIRRTKAMQTGVKSD